VAGIGNGTHTQTHARTHTHTTQARRSGRDGSSNINNLSVTAVVQRDSADDDTRKHTRAHTHTHAHNTGAAQWQGVAIAVVISTIFQLLPLCNGILLMMTLGSMFGTIKGVAIASVAATASALVCMLTARTVRISGTMCIVFLWRWVYVLALSRVWQPRRLLPQRSALVCMLTVSMCGTVCTFGTRFYFFWVLPRVLQTRRLLPERLPLCACSLRML